MTEGIKEENWMNSTNEMTRVHLMLAAGFLGLALSVSAQVKTETTTTSGQATQEVTVDRGEVVLVRGNDLVVKMEDGTIRHVPNVPESARVSVDGKELGIHDLKPGMKLQRTIIVTTTPQTITTVKTVTGKVWHVVPPTSVVLRLEDGTTQQFTIPKDQKFMVDGQQTDAWGLKKGMKVSATKIVEEPVTVVEHERRLTGSMPPPPPAPPADEPILIAVATPPPASAAAPAELPKTGSLLPLIGLLGSLSLLSSVIMRGFRRGA
jgi:RNase P/RNase MRP subunit p29